MTLTQQLHTASLGIYIILGLLLAAPAAAAAAAAAAISILSLPPIVLTLYICSRFGLTWHPFAVMWQYNDDGQGSHIVWSHIWVWFDMRSSLMFRIFEFVLHVTAGLGFGVWGLSLWFVVLGFGFWIRGVRCEV